MPETLVLKGVEHAGPFKRDARGVAPLKRRTVPCRVCNTDKLCLGFLICTNGSGYYCCDDCFAALGLLW
jgi:hypothetical protein